MHTLGSETLYLEGIPFSPVIDASGVRNFHGKGWWYHHLLKPFGLNFNGSTFVSKTTTLNARAGNMPLKPDGVTPCEWMPKCIHVNRRTGAAINAVGLSGPGMEFLLEQGFWQRWPEPFMISIMSVADTPSQRLTEIIAMTRMLRDKKPEFKAPFGVQINFSCPNTGHDPTEFTDEVVPVLRAAKDEFDVPYIVKLSPGTPVTIARTIAVEPACAALCVFNTLPWNAASDELRMSYFGTTTSPLEHRFGPKGRGGISGTPLHAMVTSWIKEARATGIRKPIIGGGGITSPRTAKEVLDAGADAISLGSIAFLAPTMVATTIDESIRYKRGLAYR